MRRRGICSYCLLVTFLFFLKGMFGANGLAAEMTPCSEDIAKFCKDAKPDRKAVMDCLDRHENELSSKCRDYQNKMTGRRMEIREEMRERARFHRACKGEIAKFCSETKLGYNETLSCLGGHEKELSAPCNELVKGAKREKEEKKTE